MHLNSLFLALAAVISGFGLVLHMRRGIPFIVAPMLASDLHHVPKHTLAFSWHWGTVTMGILMACFALAIFVDAFWPLAGLAVIYSFLLGCLSFWTLVRQQFRIGQMPQWIVFWAASLSGLLAFVAGAMV